MTMDSGVVEPKVRIGAYYKTYEPDVIALNSSVVNSDPDGIYHVLGRKGAIGSPIAQRERVMQLVEEGRQIMDVEMIDSHYAKVTRAVLDEVPFVHLGFAKSISLIRADKVQTEVETVLRNQGHFNFFKRK